MMRKDSKSFGTTYQFGYLFIKNNHPELRTEFKKKVKEAKEKEVQSHLSHCQLSLTEYGDRVCPWSINDDRAERIHRSIGEMIALDCHPFFVVDDEGLLTWLDS